MLVAAAREIGAVQIQNRGTIGGNIANGSPAGDTLPVLAAAEALVELRSADWDAQGAVHGVLHGLPRERPAARRAHHGRRDPARRGRAVVPQGRDARGAVHLEGGDGRRARPNAPRIALGSVAPTVVRVRRTEDALAAGATIAEAQRILQEEISPIDDIRSTAAYRRRGRRTPAGAVLGGHRIAPALLPPAPCPMPLVPAYFPSAASFSRAFVTSRWKTKSLSALSDLSVKFQVLPPLCFTLSSFFR